MMKIQYEDKILQSPEIVFSWIENPDKARKWQKNVSGGEILKETTEKIGTTFIEIIKENGKSLEMRGSITKYIKNKIIGFHIISRIHEFDVSYEVEGVDAGTKLSINASIRWKFPMNIISLFMRKKMIDNLKNELKMEVQDLKKLCA